MPRMSEEPSIADSYRTLRGLPLTLPKDSRGYIKGKIYRVSINDGKSTIKTIFRPEIMNIGDKFTDPQTGFEATIQNIDEVVYLD